MIIVLSEQRIHFMSAYTLELEQRNSRRISVLWLKECTSFYAHLTFNGESFQSSNESDSMDDMT